MLYEWFQSVYFAGKMGSKSWHEWTEPHVIAICGIVWWITCSHKKQNVMGSFDQFRNLATNTKGNFELGNGEIIQLSIRDETDIDLEWSQMFIRPVETRWLVK